MKIPKVPVAVAVAVVILWCGYRYWKNTPENRAQYLRKQTPIGSSELEVMTWLQEERGSLNVRSSRTARMIVPPPDLPCGSQDLDENFVPVTSVDINLVLRNGLEVKYHINDKQLESLQIREFAGIGYEDVKPVSRSISPDCEQNQTAAL